MLKVQNCFVIQSYFVKIFFGNINLLIRLQANLYFFHMSTNKKQPVKPVTISKQGETPIEVSAAYWELLKQAGGYGYKEVISVPDELKTGEAINESRQAIVAELNGENTLTAEPVVPFPDVLDTIVPDPNLVKLRHEQEAKIAELELQHKDAKGQEKANLTKEIKKLKAELI